MKPGLPRIRFALAVLSLLWTACWPRWTASAATAEQTQFYEQKIQPILFDKCYRCHSEAGARDGAKIKGGLRLDTREGLFKGGESGPAIVAGKPEASLLIKAVRYLDADLKMPPGDRKLADTDIALLEEWVRMGAPQSKPGPGSALDLYAFEKAKATNHWAFQPIFPPQPPAVPDPGGWVQSPIDAYILAELRKEGLEPAKPADKVSLVRRATFDLTGIPPTLEELDAFVADTSPLAYSNLVERLLNSPRYGERWGRYWLDLARYADTKGSRMDDRFVGSYTYRDYVIRAYNEDLPYDQFVIQQIAADRITSGEDKRSLAALGFLTLGNRFNDNADDIIADRIDVVSKSILGLTMTCARCHDHKFDPIPTGDYYSWHGIFDSSYEPAEAVVIGQPAPGKDSAAYDAMIRAKNKELREYKENARNQIVKNLVGSGGEYLLALHDAEKATNTTARNNLLGGRGLNRRWADSWQAVLGQARNQPDRILAPWVELSGFPETELSARAPGIIAAMKATPATAPGKDKGQGINPHVARLLTPVPTSLKQLAARYSTLFADVEARVRSQAKMSSPTGAGAGAGAGAGMDKVRLGDPDLDEIRRLFHDSESKVFVSDALVDGIFNRDNRIRDRINGMERAIVELESNHPGAPQHAQVLLDKNDPHDSFVHVRGNAGARGPSVPRRFLEILSAEQRPAFRDGSGRLELAKALVSEDNPLTARVMVNRIWQGHFGEGIVRTPNDFGLHADRPTHPALLDYLAWTFIEDGWSIKKMHRRIMFSSVYQQTSEDNPRYAQVDPANKLLWRMNRRRLDFEAFRDTLLFIGGKLDFTMGGPPVRLDAVPYPERRTVYGFVDRAKLPGMYRAFDFANPDLCTGKRDTTTVPQQALFLMNSPLVVEQAVNMVRRPDFAAKASAEDRVRMLYRLIYQRQPTATELRLSLKYLELEPRMPRTAMAGDTPWEFGLGQFDPVYKRVKSFAPMPLYTNSTWRLGEAALSATGGHASPYAQTAVIRRWNAPADGTATIEGYLQQQGEGDGVQGLIVSSRTGVAGTWVANNSGVDTKATLQLQEGDTIDFMVYCRASANGDDFVWAPLITFTDTTTTTPGAAPKRFEASAGFVGGVAMRYHLKAWEKFAQVLLETNELTFFN